MAIITGTNSNDILDGGTNLLQDTLIGNDGSDTYIIYNALDTIIETGTGIDDFDIIKLAANFSLSKYNLNNIKIEALDGSSLIKNMTLTGNATIATTIIGGSGNDTITGGTGTDVLTGGAGNDVLDGGIDSEQDTLIGGAGNDTYIIKDLNDSIVEIAAGGIDTIKIIDPLKDIDLTLYANIENVDATGISFDAALNGNSLANTFKGGTKNDTLYGGNDALIDILIGGAGSDTYIIQDTKDTITETGTGAGDIDTIKLKDNFSPSTYTLSNTKIEALDGSSLIKNMTLTGNATTATTIIGGSENDTLSGGTAADTIIGGTGTDVLTGGAGNDVLDGGIDSEQDTLIGGAGNDTYIIKDLNDSIVEIAAGGIDTIKIIDPLKDIDLTLYANIENVDATGISFDAALNGNSLANTFKGGTKNDTLYGGNDALIDILIGGAGSDTYIIQDTKDTITETGTGAGDIDTIKLKDNFSPSTYTLSNTKIEALDGSSLIKNMTLTGNTTTATIIIGGSKNDTLNGGTAADTLIGGAGNDLLYGGNDTISDNLQGGIGNDIYIIQDTKDTITDTNGANTIKLSSTFTGSALSLKETTAYNYSAANITTLDACSTTKAFTLTGNATTATTIIGGSANDTIVGGTDADSLTGGAGNDVLDGGIDSEQDTLIGGAGNDTYIIKDLNDSIVEIAGIAGGIDTIKLRASSVFSSFSLGSYSTIENIDASALLTTITLSGNSLANTLIGTSASDIIYGGVGADSLMGGKGSDLYYVSNSVNKVIEKANEGYDKVILNSNFNASSFAVNTNIEFLDATAVNKDLTLTGSATTSTAIWGSNCNDIINGGSADDIIMGFSGADNINGGAGNDNLDGGVGSDVISGGAGKDILYGGDDSVPDVLAGGDGQDEYYLRDIKDKIIDTSGGNTIRLKDIFTETEFSLAKNAKANDGTKYDYSAADITFLDASHVASHGLILRGSDVPTTTRTTIPAMDTIPASTTTTTTYKNIRIDGTIFDDTIISYGGDDLLWGGYMIGDEKHYGYGDDIFYGGAGSNTFLGGLGDDTYLIDGTATKTDITELADTDKVEYGNDTIKLISTNGTFDLTKIDNTGKLNGLDSFSITLADNVENLDGSLITGTSLTLTGNALDNVIKGGSGNDIITGGSKKNTLYGNDGDDTIDGGALCDTLYGGDGNDVLYGGGTADDTLTGGADYNVLDGGNGDDSYKISVVDEEAITGNGWVDLGPAPEMKTILMDSDGIDTIVLTGKSSYSTADQEEFSLTLPADIENLDASAISKDLSLVINGNALDNIIIGGTGSDMIITDDGDDTVYDYAFYTDANGNWYSGNFINVGNGNNTVVTGIGGDWITAGDGDDFIYDLGGMNNINVGDGNNRVYTGAGDDDITAGEGDDYIIGGDGNDNIDAGNGSNTLIAGAGNDDITAGTGDDYIIGGDGNDNIDAGNGSNTLIGGAGNDNLIGGDGDDTYIFSKANGNDSITDSAGNDLIKFDSSVNKNNIAVFKDDDDNLYIDYGSTLGTETITTLNNSTIEKVLLDDGTFLTNSDIDIIVQNMTTYATDNSIELNDINDVKNNSDFINIIAAEWHS